MSEIRYIRHEEAQQAAWEDPEYRRAYRKLKPRYDILQEIIQLRHKQGLTQKELAKKAKTHQSRVSKIESAELDIRLSTLIELADALDTDVEVKLVSRLPRETFQEIAALIGHTQNIVWDFPPPETQKKIYERALI